MRNIAKVLSLILLQAVFPLWALDPSDPAAPPAATAPSGYVAPLEPAQDSLEALKKSPLQGEKLELGNTFALYLPPLRDPQGAVILLHDNGGHLDTATVIHPLRRGLPEFGWASLSVQLPPLPASEPTTAWLVKTQAAINNAVTELQKRKIANIILLGHGMGALAATEYQANRKNPLVRGLILIGMDGSERNDPNLDGSVLLGKIRAPVFDIYADRDWPEVIASSARRAAAAQGAGDKQIQYHNIARNYSNKKGDQLGYRQLRFAAADHNFTEQEKVLLRRVRGWLQRYAAGMQKKLKAGEKAK